MVVFRFCFLLSVILLKYGSKGDACSLRPGDVDFQTVDLVEEFFQKGAFQTRDGANLTLPLRSVLPAGLPSTFTITATFRSNNRLTWSLIKLRSSSQLFSITLLPKTKKLAVFVQDSLVIFKTPVLFKPFWHKIHVTVTNDTVHAAVDCVELVPEGIREWDLSDATSITIVSNNYGTPPPVDLQWLSLSCNPYNVTEDSCEEIGVEVPRELPGSPGSSDTSTPATSNSIVGPRGPKGETGQKGEQGERGYTGPKGSMGLSGIPGPRGKPGSSTLIENQSPLITEDDVRIISGDVIREHLENIDPAIRPGFGNPRRMGPLGVNGRKGERGLKGDRGYVGMPGIPGVTGDTGPPGLPGPTGAIGLTGFKGDKGERGLEGPASSSISEDDVKTIFEDLIRDRLEDLSSSLRGLPGPPGLNGRKGDKGYTGLKGETGHYGPQGIPGDKGERGPDGLPGFSGIKGQKGESGPEGPSSSSISEDNVKTIFEDLIRERLEDLSSSLRGPPGEKGDKGHIGEIGDMGFSGHDGAPGAPGDKSEPGPPGVPKEPESPYRLEEVDDRDSEDPSDISDDE